MLIETTISVMSWAAGVVFAAHSLPVERDAAMRCATACLIGCIAYNWAWYPPYPQLLVGIRSTTYFCFISVLIGCFCFEKSITHWWGLPLFSLFILDICCHIVRAFGAADFYPSAIAVNGLGYLQILIFVCIGGNGVRDRLTDFADSIWYGFGSHQSAQPEKAQ